MPCGCGDDSSPNPPNRRTTPTMNNYLMAFIWLAVLGAVVYFGTRFAGRAAGKVSI